MSQEIILKNITKKLSGKVIINNFSCDLPTGKVTGLIGPNGAGKTTLIKCIAGILHPNQGTIEYPAHLEKEVISCCLENYHGYSSLSVIKNLELVAILRGYDRSVIKHFTGVLKINNILDQPLRKLSFGQLQRVNITAAIIGNPKVLFFDEPTNGLDPHGFQLFRELVNHLKQNGTTIIISSHILSEMGKICDNIILMAEGQLVKHIKERYDDEDLEKLYNTEFTDAL